MYAVLHSPTSWMGPPSCKERDFAEKPACFFFSLDLQGLQVRGSCAQLARFNHDNRDRGFYKYSNSPGVAALGPGMRRMFVIREGVAP